MNYVITGGCGFIGINLVRHLLREEENCQIRVVDNLSVGKRDDLAEISAFVEIAGENIGKTPAKQVELVVGDIRDGELAGLACRGTHAVIHLAASTGVIPSIEDPTSDCTTNVIGTLNYLEAARSSGSTRFVFASSGAPLGEQKPPVHEDMVPHPMSPYGASKLAGEAYCSAYHGAFGLETVSLRFGNVYGPYSNHKNSVVAKFIRHILASEKLPVYGDGHQSRDFLYVDDLVQAILLALKSSHIGGHVFQIATQKEHSVLEVAEELNCLAEKYLSRKSTVVFEKERKGEIRKNYSDIRKAKEVLGYQPKYDLRKGLHKAFVWFLEKYESRPMHDE